MSSDLKPRRSSRIAEVRFIEVTGTNLGATDFLAPGHTILLSRYGAKIHCEQALAPDHEITIYDPETGQDCPAKVIGLYDRLPNGYSYGIEFLDPERNFWNCEFLLVPTGMQANIQAEPRDKRSGISPGASKLARTRREEYPQSIIRGADMWTAVAPQDWEHKQLLEIRETVDLGSTKMNRKPRRDKGRSQSQRPRDARSPKVIRVKVSGTDRRGNKFAQTAYSVDISSRGARLEGLGFLATPGMIIEVKRGWRKALFCVIWVGRRGTKRAGQAGILCLEPDKNIWGDRVSQ